MKKTIVAVFLFAIILCMGGCGEKATKVWNCTVAISEDKSEYVFSEESIRTECGELRLQCAQMVDVDFCLAYEDANGEQVVICEETLTAGGVFVQYQIDPDIEYKIGIRADVEANTELTVYVMEKDAPVNDAYPEEILQEYEKMENN